MLPILGRSELTCAGMFVNFTSPMQTPVLERVADSYLKSKEMKVIQRSRLPSLEPFASLNGNVAKGMKRTQMAPAPGIG
ncbi:hypothetical protein IB248_17610 [Rhizobium sp. RHZ01]|nr:hypothetical protein [Rhizobium sp. RHZ01]